MRVLVIDEEAKEKAAQVVAYARRHVFYPDAGTEVPGDNPCYVCNLMTFRCVFTFTRDPGTGMLYRHLSISIPSKNYPSPEAVAAIAGLFEFSGAEQGLRERLKEGRWMVHIEKNEPHCIVLAEELREETPA
jgi:hypothetical protein